jgi:hypothetical protein
MPALIVGGSMKEDDVPALIAKRRLNMRDDYAHPAAETRGCPIVATFAPDCDNHSRIRTLLSIPSRLLMSR